ncbi:MAG: ABC transporter permease [Eubacteriaceae bacterium]|nr:ABC transporter permease [Eubacteriaceae bacterium]
MLFLDEPTQGLDAVSRRSLWKYINKVRNQHGTTIFLTTHYIDEAENVDKDCLINHGKIAACCSPEEIRSGLLKQELILDAENRTALTNELSALGLPFTVNGRVVVPYTYMAGGLDFEFGEFMLVGMLVNMLFMTTTMGMTSLVDDHEIDFNQEMLVSPVSRCSLVIGKMPGGSFGAILSMVVGMLIGITLPLGKLLLVLALSPLMCLAGGAILFTGGIKNKKAANLAVNLIVMPQMFISGAIIPICNSSGMLMALSRLMPMTYCLDLARAVVYSGTLEYNIVVMFNPAVNFAAISTLTIVCLATGTFFYAQSEKNR